MATSTIKKTIDTTATFLTITRTNNNYFNATNIGRCRAIKKGAMLTFVCNLMTDENAPTGATSDFIEIARISGWNAAYDIYFTIMPQGGGDKPIIVIVYANGIVKFYAAKGVAPGNFHRATACVPVANDGT